MTQNGGVCVVILFWPVLCCSSAELTEPVLQAMCGGVGCGAARRAESHVASM